MGALSLAHGANDLYMGFLPALLPLIVSRLGLSLTRAGALVSLVSLVSHLTQPVLGHWADRVGRRWLAVAGPLVTTFSLALLGLMGSYETLLLLLICGSLGNAAFHPQGAALTGRLAGPRAGTAMAVFAAGGNIGYGLGPVLIIAIVNAFGLPYTGLTIPIGVAAALLVLSSVPREDLRSEAGQAAQSAGNPRGLLAPLAVLWSVVMLRAAVATLVTTFVPLLIARREQPLMLGGWALLGFSLAGAAGGLVGGPISDRLGRRAVTVVTLGLAAPALFLFLRTGGVVAAGLLLVSGAALFAGLPVNLVMGQELLPRRASMVSGLLMGLAWAAGGLSTTVIGALADHLALRLGPAAGLAHALDASAALALAAALLALALPETRRPGFAAR